MHFLANAGADPAAALMGGQGVSWWQTAGGLLLVFGLLIVCMKLLGRFQRRQAHGRAAVLSVWNLGPRREMQILRLDDEVHTIYRHDGAMVVLKKESLAAWEASRGSAETPPAPAVLGQLLGRLLPGRRDSEPHAASAERRGAEARA